MALLNNDRYSSTTAKQLWIIQKAVAHLRVIHVPNVDVIVDHKENIEFLEQRIFDIVCDGLAGKNWSDGADLLNAVNDLNKYLKTFKLKGTVNIMSENFDQTVNDLNAAYNIKCEKNKARREKREKREENLCAIQQNELDYQYRLKLMAFLDDKTTLDELEKSRRSRVTVGQAFGNPLKRSLQAKMPSDLSEAYEAKIALINADKIQAWRDGKLSSLPYNARGEYALLRVKGSTVETSQNADVPLTHALRLLDLIERGQARKGERVGHYTLETCEGLKDVPPFVTIGCHRILLSEAQEVLKPYRNQELRIAE
jgi:hypothetical protein